MSTDVETRDGCLNPQLLAVFAEGRLKRSEIPAILAHLERCTRCRSAVATAVRLREQRSHATRWLAAAAAVVILAGAAPFVRRAMLSTPEENLIRLVPESGRIAEARLSGGFAWAPYGGPMRGEGDTESRRMKLVGVAGELVERADAKKTADAQHVAGIALVLVEEPEKAIARLRSAAERSSGARAWSDLAAAEYTTALTAGRASLYPEALAHADRALRIDPKSAEALFNRALILERLGITEAARGAWDRYLAVDASSPWAEEARAHRSTLAPPAGDALFRREQPLLERAAAGGDARAVDALVDRFRQQSRSWAEAEYLGRWAEAEQRGDSGAAASSLAIARAIGASLQRLSGESLLRDAVAAIDDSPADRRAALAAAHATYRRGRIAYSRSRLSAAESELRGAAKMFAEAGSPMTLAARYFAASARFDQNDAATARRDLEALLADAEAHPRYVALGAQVRWELALCTTVDDDWSTTATHAALAERQFAKLGERSNLAFMQTLLATALVHLGRPDEAWALRGKSFALQSAEGHLDRLPVSVGDAARVELRMGRIEAARALLDLEAAAHRAAGDDVQLSNALVRETLIDAASGDPSSAAASAREAMNAARRVTDPALRARAVADANVAAGSAALPADPRQARQLLSLAIDYYRAAGKPFDLPAALLLRARASSGMRDADAALRDLESGIAEIDRHRAVVAGPVTATSIIDARRELFEELIPLRLDRGDVASAFADSERLRARLTVREGERDFTAAALQKKLAGTDTAVLALLVLPREIVAFSLTAGDLTATRTAAPREEVLSQAARGDDAASRALFEWLVRPSQAALARWPRWIVVAGDELQQVSFAGLRDAESNRYLVETTSVAMALSASALQPDRIRAAPRSIVAVALPSGEESGTAALPAQDAEVAEVTRLYAHSVRIDRGEASLSAFAHSVPGADVLHVAGHTQRQAGEGNAALLFRGRRDGVEAVSWSGIAATSLGTPIVVLAACETLRPAQSPQTHGLSLAGGFLAAGATSVIGTLAPVADNEARDLFRSIHRQLSAGRGAAAATRAAQLEAIARPAPSRGSAWRAVAVLTNTIERPS